MKLFRRIAVVLILAVMLPALLVSAAGNVEGYRGNVTLRLRNDKGSPQEGIEIRLCQVGDAVLEQDSLKFKNTLDGKIPLGDMSAEKNIETAKKLAAAIGTVPQGSLNGKVHTAKTDAKGEARFLDLKAGAYLVEQRSKNASGQVFQPFLLYLPVADQDGSWLTEVIVSPKMAKEKPVTPSKPDSKLPQTGMLRWPVPVLALGGVTLIVIGLAVRRREES